VYVVYVCACVGFMSTVYVCACVCKSVRAQEYSCDRPCMCMYASVLCDTRNVCECRVSVHAYARMRLPTSYACALYACLSL
jgi:hypothetical protein